jgi:hypothetical protein
MHIRIHAEQVARDYKEYPEHDMNKQCPVDQIQKTLLLTYQYDIG